MAVIARFQSNTNVAIFAESAPGVFSHYVKAGASTAQLNSTGDTMTAVAVSSVTTTTATNGWVNYYGAVSGYPSGAVLKVNTRSATNYNKPNIPQYGQHGCKVTVVDASGTHIGTPVMSKKQVIYGSAANAGGAVAVRNESVDDGWVFTGWRVTRKPRLASSKMTYIEILSGAAGETDGLVTFFSAEALGDSALVIKIAKDTNATNDELLVEAVYAEDKPDEPEAATHVLSFVKNASGVTGSDIPAVTVSAGSSVVLPAPELWEYVGYEFKEWNTSPDGTGAAYAPGELYFPAGSSVAISLYAIWAVSGGSGARYRRYPDSANDGSWPRYTNRTDPYIVDVSVDGVPSGASVLLVAETCVSMGYYSDQKNLDTGAVTVHSNVAQGGTVSRDYNLPRQVAVPDTSYRTSTTQNRHGTSSGSQGYLTTHRYWAYPDRNWKWTAPEVEGLDFVGWFTIDESYSTAPSNFTWSVMISSDRVVTWGWLADRLNYTGSATTYVNRLRLVYRGKRLRVTFQPNGGECSVFRVNVYRNEQYGGLPIPSRSGYTFVGWFTDRIGGSQVTASTVVTAMSDHVLYARWSKDPVTMTVHFVGCGGTVSQTSKTVTSGEAYGSLPVPTRSGYTFLGWFTASLGGERVTSSTIVGRTFSHWLYAQWESPEPDPPEEPEEPDQPEENPLILERYPAWNPKT